VIKLPDQTQTIYEIKTCKNVTLDQLSDFVEALALSRLLAKQHKETKIFRGEIHLATSFGQADEL
jgi:hypothetical protein